MIIRSLRLRAGKIVFGDAKRLLQHYRSFPDLGARDVKAAIAHGWITMHPSGGYLSFTQAGGRPVRVVNVRLAAHHGLKSDIAPCPKSAQ
jgi:hypothetical protein